jgi:hypothetical protein
MDKHDTASDWNTSIHVAHGKAKCRRKLISLLPEVNDSIPYDQCKEHHAKGMYQKLQDAADLFRNQILQNRDGNMS